MINTRSAMAPSQPRSRRPANDKPPQSLDSAPRKTRSDRATNVRANPRTTRTGPLRRARPRVRHRPARLRRVRFKRRFRESRCKTRRARPRPNMETPFPASGSESALQAASPSPITAAPSASSKRFRAVRLERERAVDARFADENGPDARSDHLLVQPRLPFSPPRAQPRPRRPLPRTRRRPPDLKARRQTPGRRGANRASHPRERRRPRLMLIACPSSREPRQIACPYLRSLRFPPRRGSEGTRRGRRDFIACPCFNACP